MSEYHKINSIFKRDQKTNKFILGDWSTPEIEYLSECPWEFTEKVDGTNVRVIFPEEGGVVFGGRTDNAQMPTTLLQALQKMFPPEIAKGHEGLVLYGEGYGPKIQKGGGLYRDDVSFVLFDARAGKWWLRRESVEAVAIEFGLDVVPIVGYGNLQDGIDLVKGGLKSTWGDFEAEGIVARPVVPMLARDGSRIITKIKGRDFK